MYLTQSDIASDMYMVQRVAQCATGEGCVQAGIDADLWAHDWRRVWASAPGWDIAWESALASHPPVDTPPGEMAPPKYQPGADPAVITDGEILAQVQSMMPFSIYPTGRMAPPP